MSAIDPERWLPEDLQTPVALSQRDPAFVEYVRLLEAEHEAVGRAYVGQEVDAAWQAVEDFRKEHGL